MNRHIPALAAMMLTFALFAALIGNFYISPHTTYAEAKREIYLTFDDGPSDKVTPEILDILKEEKVPATFFVVGRQVERRRYILKRIFDEGHTVGVHSYSHKYKDIYKSEEALIEDIDKCNDIICSVTGEYTNVYRFPGGSFTVSDGLKNAVTAKGYRFIDWNASFRDSEIEDATAGELYTAAITTVTNPQRIVMLAHDATDKIETAGALKEVIRHFKNKGYTFKKF